MARNKNSKGNNKAIAIIIAAAIAAIVMTSPFARLPNGRPAANAVAVTSKR